MKTKLLKEFDRVMENAARFTTQFPWQNKEAYALWLAQTYFFVRHSSRLLALGAAAADFNREALHKRMLEHLKEELGHDKVAAMDLKRLGYDVEKLREFAVTKAFYQTQYYVLQNRSAAAFLGWVLFLEGFAAQQGPKVHALVEGAYGAKCSHFVRMHTEEDQEHVRQALLAAADLSEREQDEIVENMRQSAELYEVMLAEVKAEVVADRARTIATQRSSSILEPAMK